MSDDNDNNLKLTFETVNPPDYTKLASKPEAFRTLKEADDWYKKTRIEFGDYVTKHRAQMIDEQTANITLERSKSVPGLTPPIPKPAPEIEARQRVDAYVNAQFDQIKARHAEMQQQVIAANGQTREQSAPQKTVAHPLSKATHAEIDASRDRLLKEAENIFGPGEQFEAFKAREAHLRKDHHRSVGRTFNEHGVERQPVQSQAQSSPSQ